MSINVRSQFHSLIQSVGNPDQGTDHGSEDAAVHPGRDGTPEVSGKKKYTDTDKPK